MLEITQYLSHYCRSFNQELWYYCATMPEMGGKGTSWSSDGLGLTGSQNTLGRECIDCLIQQQVKH